jgi:hypothetical protein
MSYEPFSGIHSLQLLADLLDRLSEASAWYLVIQLGSCGGPVVSRIGAVAEGDKDGLMS